MLGYSCIMSHKLLGSMEFLRTDASIPQHIQTIQDRSSYEKWGVGLDMLRLRSLRSPQSVEAFNSCFMFSLFENSHSDSNG